MYFYRKLKFSPLWTPITNGLKQRSAFNFLLLAKGYKNTCLTGIPRYFKRNLVSGTNFQKNRTWIFYYKKVKFERIFISFWLPPINLDLAWKKSSLFWFLSFRTGDDRFSRSSSASEESPPIWADLGPSPLLGLFCIFECLLRNISPSPLDKALPF